MTAPRSSLEQLEIDTSIDPDAAAELAELEAAPEGRTTAEWIGYMSPLIATALCWLLVLKPLWGFTAWAIALYLGWRWNR